MEQESGLARAATLLQFGRPSAAEPLLRQLIVDDPQATTALVLLAQTLLGTDRPAETLEIARRAVAANPGSEHAYRVLAHAEIEAGKQTAAERAAREAVRLAPGEWRTHFTLGLALRERWTGKEDALECAREAMRLAPHESPPHTLAGLCYSDLRLREASIREYRKALELDPTNAIAMNNLAAMDLNEGKLTSAGALIRTGLAISPQEDLLQRNYDVLLFRLVRRLYVALFGLGFVLLVMASDDAPYLARAGTAAALLGLYAAAAYRVVRTLPRGTHLWAKGLFRRSTGSQRMSLATFLVLTLGVLAVGLSPSSVADRIGMAFLRLFQALVLGTLLWRAVRRRRKPTGQPPNGTW